MKSTLKIILASILTIGMIACNKNNVPETAPCCSKKNTSQITKNINALIGLNDQSLYQLPGTWTTQLNREIELEQFKGEFQLVSMIFTHCGYACPRMVDNMQAVKAALPQNLRDDVSYVLVSFDTERDNPARLKKYAEVKNLGSDWTLLHGDEAQVRNFSMLLKVKYNKLPNGNFAHSNVLTLLNKEGVVVAQFEGLEIDTEIVVNTIKQML